MTSQDIRVAVLMAADVSMSAGDRHLCASSDAARKKVLMTCHLTPS